MGEFSPGHNRCMSTRSAGKGLRKEFAVRARADHGAQDLVGEDEPAPLEGIGGDNGRAHPARDPLGRTEGTPDGLIAPHGGLLVDLIAGGSRVAELQAASRDWPSWNLSGRQLCDLELLASGGFSPLAGFMGRQDYESVCARMRLADGCLWPIPITLDVSEELARRIGPGSGIALRDPEGVMLAALTVEEMWKPDRTAEALSVYGTASLHHPGVAHILERTQPWIIAGTLEGTRLPAHSDFRHLRLTPSELRTEFGRRGWRRVVGFNTRNPMHRAHYELTRRAAEQVSANVLLHPVVGTTKPGDVDHYTRVRCYRAILNRYPQGGVALALLPLSMRMAGPREALWHAIIRKNYGCSHFIVGRDQVSPGEDSDGTPFYGRYEAQDLVRAHEEELGVGMVPFKTMVYARELDAFMPEDRVPDDLATESVSGTQLRRLLAQGRPIPEWFTFPEVAAELRRRHPPRHDQGLTIFFTGLSGSGKSTIAKVLQAKFLERGDRPVTLLDGDLVRKHLSSELGFSKEHRDLNIRRIGYVASEITRNGGVAICSAIAPYDAVRKEVRTMIEPEGGFVLVHVGTCLEECERRDAKGLYARARAGLIPEFTGISDPYEVPEDASLTIQTTEASPEDAAELIIAYLEKEGYLTLGGEQR